MSAPDDLAALLLAYAEAKDAARGCDGEGTRLLRLAAAEIERLRDRASGLSEELDLLRARAPRVEASPP